jgi:hypothetical protein
MCVRSLRLANADTQSAPLVLHCQTDGATVVLARRRCGDVCVEAGDGTNGDDESLSV